MSLTLNQASNDDNLVIFLMEMRVEGNNQIANSGFNGDDDTGWTLNGDWIVDENQLRYIYDSVAGATAQYTIAATTNGATYVVEYKIIETNGTFTFELEGAFGANIITGDLTIPQTVGKHSVRIVCDGGTVFGLGTGGMGAGDYIYVDDIKIRKEVDIIRLSTRDVDLGDANIFDGQIIKHNQLTDVDSFIDVEVSGGIGAITGYSFQIARHTANARTSDFFNEFFPAYDGGQIVAREILFGFIWDDGSPDYSEVTWLMNGKAIDYSYEPRAINLIVLQSTEIDTREIPYYSVQKDFNNFVSYFPSAPDENYGNIIPIVYGIHDVGTSITGGAAVEGLVTYSPGIIVDYEKNSILIASHKCESIAAVSTLSVYKFIEGLNSYMGLTSASDATVNNNLNSYYSVTDTNTDIIGSMIIPLKAQSSYSGVGTLFNVMDKDTTNFKQIDTTERLALGIGGSASTTEVGWLSVTDGQSRVVWRVGSNDAGDRDWTLGINNLTYGTPPNLDTVSTGTIVANNPSTVEIVHNFGASVVMKKDAIMPWTIEEVCNLEFYIINDDVDAGDYIEVYYATLKLSNIKVSGIGKQYTVKPYEIPSGIVYAGTDPF